jgi:hypothetical protein
MMSEDEATLHGDTPPDKILWLKWRGASSHLRNEFGMERKINMSSDPRPKLSEKGLLTPDNCVVAFIDHQPQMLFGVSNFDRQSIINNTVALAKATQVFDVPVVLTTVETKSFSGKYLASNKGCVSEPGAN